MSKFEKIWDAIIIGAGPAGCAAAYDLARSGKRVLLLDKNDFPRSKACAGGLTLKTTRALRYSVEPVIRQQVRKVVMESGTAQPVLFESAAPFVTMTVRAEFDAYCFRQTLDAGANFCRIRAVRDIQQSGNGVTVETDTESMRASFVVGADGVNSAVRRFCRNIPHIANGFAIEAQVPIQSPSADLVIDLNAVRHGYGWVFPKGDHLNIGLGFYRFGERLNRERLIAYIRHRFETDKIEHVVGQYLGIQGANSPCASGRILLAGDAAGLADSLTGEGIYSAVVSGQAAAQAIESASRGTVPVAEAYETELRPLKNRLSLADRAAYQFYTNPERVLRVMSVPWINASLMKAYVNRKISSGRHSRFQAMARRLTYGAISLMQPSSIE